MPEKKLAVVALGGNALVIDKNRKTIPDQFDAVKETVGHIADMIEGGWQVIVTHGNGYTHGYEISRVEVRDKQTFIILAGDHGLRIKGKTTEEVFFPRRTIEGQNTFVIPLSTAGTGDQTENPGE